MFSPDQMKLVVGTIEKMIHDNDNCGILLLVYGQKGMQIKNILNLCYGREEKYIIDNRYAKYNSKIKSTDFLNSLDCSKYVVLFSVLNSETNYLYDEVKEYFDERKIYIAIDENEKAKIITKPESLTKCGKHSTGVLCNHWLVESVGAFCSFARGCDVVANHALDYLSTAPFIYDNEIINEPLKFNPDRNTDDAEKTRLPGIVPQGKIRNFRRIKIGNDVWLGHGVLIANGSDIGNGVIAGAGAVITKPVPDYAVVGGGTG